MRLDICKHGIFANEELFKQLCKNGITKGFNEIVATFLCKLLMDDCGIAVNEVFENIPNWDSFMYKKNPVHHCLRE